MFNSNIEYITALELRNFRNHKLIKLDFNHQIINILGNNGAGKTSILESFSLFFREIALREKKINNIINSDSQNLQIFLQFTKNNINNNLFLQYNNIEKKKKIYLNESLIKKYSFLREYFHCICFSPSLYAKFLHNAQFRRQFYDNITHSFFDTHLSLISNYNYLRQERQKILHKIDYDHDWMHIIEKKISILAVHIAENREKCLNILQKNLYNYNYNILLFGKFEECLTYNNDFSSKMEIFQNILYENRNIDLKLNQTNIGPHRTKIGITINNKHFDQSSSGEQKRAFLFILLIQVQEKISLHNIYPILLFDDIISQFDIKNINEIMELIKKIGVQCFITNAIKYSNIQGQIINL